MIVRRAILPLGLLALLSCQLVSASDNDDGGLDNLNNGQGQTPCDLANGIKQCGASRRARGLVSRSLNEPRATESSNCTCTNVYFNLWSSCLVMNNKGPPSADRWTSQCEDDGFQITSARFDGYDIPSWAYADMPAGNAIFNVQQAIGDASAEKDKWTKFQIITVVAVISSLVVIIAIFIFLYRWRQVWSRQHGIKRPPRTLRLPRMPSGTSFLSRSSRHKVQPSDDDDFEIDHDVEELDANYEIVGDANTARSRSGHIRLPSSPIPVRRNAQPSVFHSIAPTFHRLARTIPIPWKTRPRGLSPVSGDAIFDIDDGPHHDSRYRSDSTLQNYRNPLRANYAPKVPSSNRTRSEPMIEEELNIDSDSEDEARPAHFDSGHERERLITNVYPSRDSPADVMLISRSGQDFTIESGETPITGPSSHGQQTLQPPQRAIKSHSPRPRVPPAPKSPAPVPPTSPPRSTARLRQASDDSMQGFGGLAPSYSTPTAPASPRRPVSRMASNDNMLGLSGVHHSAAASSNTLPTAPSSSNPNLPIDPPSPLYIRRPSNDALRHQYQSTSNFGVPQPIPNERMSGYSTDLEIPSISSPPYHPSPLRDERILAPLRNESPYTPPPPLTPRPEQDFSPRHSRNVSSESMPGRGDPVMLFSGPVRAAGYMRSTSQTRS